MFAKSRLSETIVYKVANQVIPTSLCPPFLAAAAAAAAVAAAVVAASASVL